MNNRPEQILENEIVYSKTSQILEFLAHNDKNEVQNMSENIYLKQIDKYSLEMYIALETFLMENNMIIQKLEEHPEEQKDCLLSLINKIVYRYHKCLNSLFFHHKNKLISFSELPETTVENLILHNLSDIIMSFKNLYTKYDELKKNQ